MNPAPDIFSPEIPAVSVERLAAKFAAIRQQTAPEFATALSRQPRLRELAWWLESASRGPGGLTAVAQRLLDLFPDRVGSEAMHALGKTAEPYTEAERLTVIQNFPASIAVDWAADPHFGVQDGLVIRQFSEEMLGAIGGDYGRHQPDPAVVNSRNHPYFYDVCRRFLLARLPHDLARFCNHPDAVLQDPWEWRSQKQECWCFCGLEDCLIELMDAGAAAATEPLALTNVARQIMDAAAFALDEKALVEVIGSSRFGKSETAKTLASAWPGRYRLLNCPCDGTDRAFYEAAAAALGLLTSPAMPYGVLKSKLNFIMANAQGLCFLIDEAHWLAPRRFTSKTPPMRYDWLRTVVLDNGGAVLVLVTPQFAPGKRDTFEKVTGWNAAQWRGRILRKVTLPDELTQEDLQLVVNKHLPGLAPRLQLHIISAALLTDSYLFAVEKIGKNARAVARAQGRSEITAADLNEGVRLSGINAPAIPSGTAAVGNSVSRSSAAPGAISTPKGVNSPRRPARPVTRESFLEDVAAGRLGRNTTVLVNDQP